MRPYTNPLMTTPEEVTTQRFYLRKIEGAEVLLAFETNFFRQELHKWAPVAPVPPPVLENSFSTRKPRPTKQQKMMTQLGIDNPDDLPQQFRTKQHNFSKARKSSDAHSNKSQHPLQPAPRNRNRSDTPRSTSTSAGPDPHTHSHRLPATMSSTHTDPTYTAYFPATSPHSHHPHSGSPGFGPGPYIQTHHSHNSHHSLMNSPGFSPHSPLNHSGAPLDPNLFSPTNSHFSSSMSGLQNHNHSQMLSPQHSTFPGHRSGVEMDNNLFDDFVVDPSDDIIGRNEAAEALEDRRREDEDELYVDEFSNHL